jgi:hypothetical protein
MYVCSEKKKDKIGRGKGHYLRCHCQAVEGMITYVCICRRRGRDEEVKRVTSDELPDLLLPSYLPMYTVLTGL